MNDKYRQALARQQWERSVSRVVLIERLEDGYRYTTADGLVVSVDMEFGLEHHPVALCGK